MKAADTESSVLTIPKSIWKNENKKEGKDTPRFRLLTEIIAEAKNSRDCYYSRTEDRS